MLSFQVASAQVSVSGGTGGSTLCAGGGYVSLTPIVISETANGDISMGTLALETLNLTLSNAAYEFEPNVGSVSFTGTGAASILASINVTATQISISIAEGDNNNSTGLNALTITGIRVRATAGAGAANLRRAPAGGTISINGFAAGTNVSSVQGFASPTVNAGSDATVCQNTAFNFITQSTPSSASAGTTLSWSHNGLGVITNGSTLTPTYTPSAAETGVVTFTLQATNTNGSCSPVTEQMQLTINPSTMVSVPPSASVICENENTSFTVVASGTSLTYQWRENGLNISNGGVYNGATSPTLTLTNVPASFSGRTYSVTVSGTCGSVTTTPAVPLTVNVRPLIVAGNPTSETICQNDDIDFVVDAGATTGVSYQWQVSVNGGSTFSDLSNGGNYAGVNSGILNLTNVPVSFHGNLYRAVVNGVCSPSVTSNAAILTVNANPVVNTPPSPQTVCEDGVATFSVSATGTGLTYLWYEDGTPLSNGGVYSGVTTSTLTLSGVTSAFNSRDYHVVITGGCSSPVATTPVNLTVNEKPQVSNPTNSTICQGTSTSFSVSTTPTTSPTYQWQVSTNGGVTFNNLTNVAPYSGVTTATLNLNAVPLANNNFLYRVVVNGTCSPSVTSNAALLRVNTTTSVTTPPAVTSVCEDGTAMFNVVASGTALGYQWREGGVPISNGGVYSGVTTTSLTLTGVASAFNARVYSVTVSGACGTVTSAGAALTINEKPEILDQPDNTIICDGDDTSFEVDPGLTTAPTYQWQVSTNGGVSFSNVVADAVHSGITTAMLSLTDVPLTHQGRLYRVVVSGACAPSITSNAAVLGVNANPVVTTAPTAQVSCEGGTATFNVVATGAGLAYQWRENGTPISNGGIYSGATSPTLTLTGVTAAMSGRTYSVVITGSCDNATTTAVALTVNINPVITSHPSSVVICESDATSFTVNAGTTTSPSYQWQISTDGGVSYTDLTSVAPYSGVTTATLNVSSASLSMNGNRYRVRVSGTCSSPVTSNAAVLGVNANPVVTTAPTAQVSCEGGTATFNVVATGAGLAYQWRENGTPISNGGIYSGATSPTLTLTGVTAAMSGRTYDVVITGSCDNATTTAVALTVNRNPDAFATDATICSGATTNIIISNPNAVAGTTFTWSIQSSTNVSGASSGSGALIAQTLSSTDGVTAGIITYIIQPSASGCNGVPFAVSVNVRPIPNVAASPQTICSGATTNIWITNPNNVSGTAFNWIVQSVSNVTGALPGSGNTINQRLTSTDGITPGAVTYRITPIAGGCQGSFIDVTVTVNPIPVVTNPPTDFIQKICSGVALNFVPTSTVTGTTFNWTSTVIGTLTGVSTSGTGPITDTPINATSTDAVIIYTITPTIAGCAGAPVNLVVTVHPVPSATASSQNICSGQSTSIAISGGPKNVSGTTFSWTIPNFTNASGFAIGSGNVISQLLSSVDQLNNGVVTYRILPTANGCDGPTLDVTATVKPVPVVNNPTPSLAQQICSSAPLNFVPTTAVSGSTFTWTSTITGPVSGGSVTASGSGSITDSPVNTGNVQGTVTYRITPHNNGCDGPTVDFIVTVKPVPTATASGVVICSGETAAISISPLPNNVANTTFSWVAAPTTNIIGASNGNGSLISQSLSTTNASMGSVVYTITPAADGCNGSPVMVTVTVNPFAIVSAGADIKVCQDAAAPVTVPVTGTIGGSATSATWFVKTGLGTVSASTTTGGTVTATYNTQPGDIGGVVELYLVTNDPDGAGGPCTVKSDTLKIFMNPTAKIVPLIDQVVCDPGVINLSGTLAGSATSGSWTPETTGGGALTISSITGSVVTASYSTVAADVPSTVSFRLTSNDPDGSGPCTPATDVVSITINESARVFAGADFAVCEDSLFQLHGDFDKATSSVTWTGGSGATRFSNVNDTASTYSLTPADIAAGSITFTLTSNDPDAGGPCIAVSDNVVVKVNELPDVFFFGLEDFYAENSPVDDLSPVPVGGDFSGPGIIAGTYQFKPSAAGFGPIVITYEYTDPKTGCTNSVSDNTIVNPVTDVDFYIENNPRDEDGHPVICSNQGVVNLIGVPASDDNLHQDPTFFEALSPELIPRMSESNQRWTLNTTDLPAGTYLMQYTYKNQYGASNTITRDIIVHATPTATIDVTNECIDKIVTFHESSTFAPIQNNTTGVIDQWTWTYGESTNGSDGPNPEPTYQYITPGDKNVTLRVTTNEGCSNIASKVITIGTPPSPDFEATGICLGDVKKFVDKSTSSFGTITHHAWDFGDGDTLGMSVSNKVIPVGKHAGKTTGIWKNPNHEYTDYQVYSVTLTVGTDSKCSASTTKEVFILQTPLTSTDYFTDFDSGPGTWVAVGEPITQSSWNFSMPDGEYIKKKYPTDSAWVTSGNDGTYFNGEQSFVYGPCLNLTAIDRPMVSMNYQVDTKEGFDGAVLQYSTNSGQTWKTIGNAAPDQGINWYNRTDVVGNPGGDDNYAWSAIGETSWKNARFNLDQIPLAERDTVVFRIAFGSSLDASPGRKLNGFAFDDVYIGSKKRMVLVEHITNDASFNAEDEFIDNDIASDNFIKLQYHLSTPTNDEVNEDNPFEHLARAVFYNVARPPATFMDGILGPYYNTTFDGLVAKMTPEVLDRRSLEDPSFEISIVFNDTIKSYLSADITYTFIDTAMTYTKPVILQAALVESGPGANDNKNALRKLLLERSGFMTDKPLNKGEIVSFVKKIRQPINFPIGDGDSLSVIAFAQELTSQNVKKVLQATIAKAPLDLIPLGPVANEQDQEASNIELYPNPASMVINFASTQALRNAYSYRLIDQRGVTVLDGNLKRDLRTPQEVDISKLANGIYFMAIVDKKRVVRYEKIAILNQY
ncbi:PKD-like domain-containing protein [Pseudochryseolinea flava]|uniref:PKD domain-containing protein n=1 Tax=Pseudochryseolinea flava TaxID=2059302 RepID=A0A364XUI3_9BACT|nr:PKD-like domain-containing protein [Pseudochryseolinea flava]RAV97989.1 hypothetical protein DQQ10_25640 [Pseudochryseolinea flava]